jgi:hypothetical protein
MATPNPITIEWFRNNCKILDETLSSGKLSFIIVRSQANYVITMCSDFSDPISELVKVDSWVVWTQVI